MSLPGDAPTPAPIPNLRKHLDLEGVLKILALGGVLYTVGDKLMDFGVTRDKVAQFAQLAQEQAQTKQDVKEQRVRMDFAAAEQAKTAATFSDAVGKLEKSVDRLNEAVTQVRIHARR